MAVLKTHAKPEVEVDPRDLEAGQRPGTGGRGPTRKRPTGGGGDNDNWSNQPSGRRGPREALGSYRLLLVLGLIGDVAFFVVLAIVSFTRKGVRWDPGQNAYVTDWTPIHMPEILWLNTALLLLSTVSMEAARRRLFREPYVTEEWFGLGRPGMKWTLSWLATTITLGGAFLAGQYVAWLELWKQRVFLRNGPSSQFFYVVTAAHGLHLLLGMLALLFAGAVVLWGKRIQARQIAVDIAGWFWHAMGALWIFLFVLLEFCQ